MESLFFSEYPTLLMYGLKLYQIGNDTHDKFYLKNVMDLHSNLYHRIGISSKIL